MDYIEVVFTCEPNNEVVNTVLCAEIAEIGFESFVETESGTTAYINKDTFNEDVLKNVLDNLLVDAKVSYVVNEIAGQDWNEEWEKNYFKPLVIDDKCIIQSTFHNEPAVYDYNILIDPKMAFGTGHHQTTELMIREILKMDLQGKAVLDMGCGTAILAILASMRGANPIVAIDIDEWAYDNAMENLKLNNTDNIEVKIGGADLLGEQMFDVILANINRNILLNDINKYSSVLKSGGEIYMSGFYKEDIPYIQAECEKYNMEFCYHTEKENWVAVKFIKL